MSTLVKISNVVLYVGFTSQSDEVFACKKLLDDSAIKYELRLAFDKNKETLTQLSANVYGLEFLQYELKDFPIITWKEYYDDYERFLQIATNSSTLETSNLIVNRAVVK